jgi:hypothetical protein
MIANESTGQDAFRFIEGRPPISVRKAVREVLGEDVNASTIWRWCTQGSRGIVMKSVFVRGERRTYPEFVREFFEQVDSARTAAVNT